jgi:hypothetical protein
MRPDTLEKLKTLLIEACDKHLADGGKLEPYKLHYDFATKTCCPITALTGDTGLIDRCKILTAFLGENMSERELGSFFEGFDGIPVFESHLRDIYLLGCDLREKYLGLKNDFRDGEV